MRSIFKIARKLMGAYRAGRLRAGAIIASAAILLICAAAVAVIGNISPISDYWEFITVVIAVVLAYIVVF